MKSVSRNIMDHGALEGKTITHPSLTKFAQYEMMRAERTASALV